MLLLFLLIRIYLHIEMRQIKFVLSMHASLGREMLWLLRWTGGGLKGVIAV